MSYTLGASLLANLALAGYRLPSESYQEVKAFKISPQGFWEEGVAKNGKSMYPEDHSFAVGVARFLAAEGARTVLDIGCGDGAIADTVARMSGAKVVGLDGVKSFDNGPVATYDESGGTLEFWHTDFSDLFAASFRDRPIFDWVVSFAVAEHVAVNLEHIYLANLLRAAPKQGLLLVWDKRGASGMGHVNCRDEKEVLRIFVENFGYRIDRNATKWLQRRAKKRWYKLALVLRAPPRVRKVGDGSPDQLASGFGIVPRTAGGLGALVVGQGSEAGDLLRLSDGRSWKRAEDDVRAKSAAELKADLRGAWYDSEGNNVTIGC
eukprot:TRINITY_DN20912_c0_g1_i5.p1 TRINITY_DN20912_c0_g1~~TRINITY_DN20912_c0_g1_i5.p1  ORF type:complete len:321 (-),score=42.04 TRINITY_DN20912_c0_g1_i5:193-1155(-)